MQLSPDEAPSNIVVAYGVGLSGDWANTMAAGKSGMNNLAIVSASERGAKTYFSAVVKSAHVPCIDFGVVGASVGVVALHRVRVAQQLRLAQARVFVRVPGAPSPVDPKSLLVVDVQSGDVVSVHDRH